MKATQSFSLGRVALLARKHYTENRQSYLIYVGIYLLFMAFSLWRALEPELPSMAAFESSLLFVSLVTPILAAKYSFSNYYQTGKQIDAFTLPATTGEKFLFATLNTLLLSALSIGIMEVAASLVAPESFEACEVSISYSYIAGHWFGGLTEFLQLSAMFFAVSILACTMAHKGNVAKPMFAIWGVILLLHFLPIILFHDGYGTSVGEINIPHFSSTLEHLYTVGDTQIEFFTERFFLPEAWHSLIIPVILLVAAWFRFREYETK